MIDFEFIIDKEYLFLHAFRYRSKGLPDWVRLHNKIWETDKDVYDFLAGRPEVMVSNLSLKQLSSKADKVIADILRTNGFKKAYKETNLYKKWISKQWDNNKTKINSILESVLKIDIPKLKFKVFLTHPKLTNGCYLGDYRICWGHPEEWNNYSLVYLVHEALHETLKDYGNLGHAVIELIADNELRIKLNKKGKYFQFKGHEELSDLEKKLYPYWKKYLKDDTKNIFDFLKNAKKNEKYS